MKLLKSFEIIENPLTDRPVADDRLSMYNHCSDYSLGL